MENNSATGVVSSIEITFTAEEITQVPTPDLSISEDTYFAAQNVSIACALKDAVIHYTTDGTEPSSNSPTYSSAISLSTSATTTIKAIAIRDGLDDSEIASATYTIYIVSPNAKGLNSDYYTKVTNINELEDGDAILIVNEGQTCAMSTTESSSVRLATDVTISGNSISSPSASVQKITLVKVNNKYFFYTGSENGYLYAAGGTSNNYLKTTTTLNTDALASISISSGDATITFQGSSTKNLLRYNYNGGTNPRFTCYGSGQQSVQIYKEVIRTPPTPTSSGDETYLTTSDNMAGWRAFYDASNSYSVDSNTKVYVADADPIGTTITLKAIDGIPADVPVILHTSSSADSYKMTLTKETVSPFEYTGTNKFIWTTSAVDNKYRLGYGANGIGFYPYTGTPSAGAVILDITPVNSARALTFKFEDETTGIDASQVNSEERMVKSVFDLQGRRVAQPTKGLYIVNGKKVIIK